MSTGGSIDDGDAYVKLLVAGSAFVKMGDKYLTSPAFKDANVCAKGPYIKPLPLMEGVHYNVSIWASDSDLAPSYPLVLNECIIKFEKHKCYDESRDGPALRYDRILVTGPSFYSLLVRKEQVAKFLQRVGHVAHDHDCCIPIMRDDRFLISCDTLHLITMYNTLMFESFVRPKYGPARYYDPPAPRTSMCGYCFPFLSSKIVLASAHEINCIMRTVRWTHIEHEEDHDVVHTAISLPPVDCAAHELWLLNLLKIGPFINPKNAPMPLNPTEPPIATPTNQGTTGTLDAPTPTEGDLAALEALGLPQGVVAVPTALTARPGFAEEAQKVDQRQRLADAEALVSAAVGRDDDDDEEEVAVDEAETVRIADENVVAVTPEHTPPSAITPTPRPVAHLHNQHRHVVGYGMGPEEAVALGKKKRDRVVVLSDIVTRSKDKRA